MIYLFLSEKIPIDLTALLGVLVLTFSGFITPQEAFSGFSSPAVITLASMFVIGAGLSATGACDLAARYVSSMTGRHETVNVLVIMVMGALLSAFMNNVAATAVLLPTVSSIAVHNQLCPSRLLIPLAFATVLGGTCTMIGTSPNILIADVARETHVAQIGIFDFTILGVCMTIPGILFMTLIGRRLLPKRELNKRAKASGSDLSHLYRLYERMFSLRVPEHADIVGKSIAETRFRQVLNVQLLAVAREGERILNPSPHTIIQAHDVLIVQGRVSRFEALASLRGLEVGAPSEVPDSLQDFARRAQRYQVVGSNLVGKSLRDLNFRDSFGVVVLGVEQSGEVQFRNIANKRLKEGDILYLIGEGTALEGLKERGLQALLENATTANLAQ
ncbi:MAG: SLC13 family permease, partial [Bdellovibrionales bacterium]|nr:SLC13 family permease [Bdellovibrionales bacterium]